jgi:hypothetical protein
MTTGHVLTLRKEFDRAAQAAVFAQVKADLSGMQDARLISEQGFIGTMVIEVDSDAALQMLQNKYSNHFHIKPEGTMRALKK